MRDTLRASVLGCKQPECKKIYNLCWICGYCRDAHCDCLEEANDAVSEVQEL